MTFFLQYLWNKRNAAQENISTFFSNVIVYNKWYWRTELHQKQINVFLFWNIVVLSELCIQNLQYCLLLSDTLLIFTYIYTFKLSVVWVFGWEGLVNLSSTKLSYLQRSHSSRCLCKIEQEFCGLISHHDQIYNYMQWHSSYTKCTHVTADWSTLEICPQRQVDGELSPRRHARLWRNTLTWL